MQSAGVAVNTEQEDFVAAPFSRRNPDILDLYEKSPRGYFVRPAAYKVHYFQKFQNQILTLCQL